MLFRSAAVYACVAATSGELRLECRRQPNDAAERPDPAPCCWPSEGTGAACAASEPVEFFRTVRQTVPDAAAIVLLKCESDAGIRVSCASAGCSVSGTLPCVLARASAADGQRLLLLPLVPRCLRLSLSLPGHRGADLQHRPRPLLRTYATTEATKSGERQQKHDGT